MKEVFLVIILKILLTNLKKNKLLQLKNLIEMLETCNKESIVYINCGDDINSIDEICDYSNNCGEVIIVSN